jgi:hypothetical protein
VNGRWQENPMLLDDPLQPVEPKQFERRIARVQPPVASSRNLLDLHERSPTYYCCSQADPKTGQKGCRKGERISDRTRMMIGIFYYLVVS